MPSSNFRLWKSQQRPPEISLKLYRLRWRSQITLKQEGCYAGFALAGGRKTIKNWRASCSSKMILFTLIFLFSKIRWIQIFSSISEWVAQNLAERLNDVVLPSSLEFGFVGNWKSHLEDGHFTFIIFRIFKNDLNFRELIPVVKLPIHFDILSRA